MQHFDSYEERVVFRDVVVQTAAGGDACNARRIWDALLGGTTMVADAFYVGTTSYLVVTDSEGATPLSPRMRLALASALRGTSHKAVAIDLGVGASTVASALKTGLARLGLGGLPSKVPLCLAALAQAAASESPTRYLSSARVSTLGRQYEVIRAHPADLGHLLSPAVEQVVALHAQGKSYAEIAATRNTSTRTVANQISSAFQRLRVSGRADLLSCLIGGPCCEDATAIERSSIPLEGLESQPDSIVAFGRGIRSRVHTVSGARSSRGVVRTARSRPSFGDRRIGANRAGARPAL